MDEDHGRPRRTYEVFLDGEEPLVVALSARSMEEALEEVRQLRPAPGSALSLREVDRAS